MRNVLLGVALLAVGGSAFAMTAEDVVYQIGDQTFEGYVAYDESLEGPLPGILIVHDWNGLGDYEKMRAEMLAEMGYVAFAVDIYGQGVRPANAQESQAESSKYYGDLDLYVERMQAGLDQLRMMEQVDDGALAAIGYCFGGSGVLQLARANANVAGVVSFHGGLSTSQPASGSVSPKVMAINASQDPVVPKEDIVGFMNEMDAVGADYQLIVYNIQGHSFTVPGGNDYDATADARSWEAMDEFFEELFETDEDEG